MREASVLRKYARENLADHGYELIRSNPNIVHVFPDGTSNGLFATYDETCESIGKFSNRDARRGSGAARDSRTALCASARGRRRRSITSRTARGAQRWRDEGNACGCWEDGARREP